MDSKFQSLYEQLVLGERTGDMFKDEAIARDYDIAISQIFGIDFKQYHTDINFLLDLTSYKSTDLVVDLGCGTGISTRLILERKPGRIIGIDFSEPMIQQAREKFKGINVVDFRVVSGEELSDVVSNADKVVSANFFQYISSSDEVLHAIYGALHSDGEYLFNVKVKAPGEQSVYFQLFKAAERAIKKVFGVEITLPKVKGVEPKYERIDLEKFSARNGFVIVRYEEKPVIYGDEQLRGIYQQCLGRMIAEFEEEVGKKATNSIIDSIQEELSIVFSPSGFIAGKEAHVCLRKR